MNLTSTPHNNFLGEFLLGLRQTAKPDVLPHSSHSLWSLSWCPLFLCLSFFLFKMLNLWMFPFPPSDLFLENGLRSFTVKMTNSFYCDTHQGYFYFTSRNPLVVRGWKGGKQVNRIALCKSENTFTYYLLWVCCPMLDLMPIRHLTWPTVQRKLEWSIHFHPSSQVGFFTRCLLDVVADFGNRTPEETPPKENTDTFNI